MDIISKFFMNNSTFTNNSAARFGCVMASSQSSVNVVMNIFANIIGQLSLEESFIPRMVLPSELENVALLIMQLDIIVGSYILFFSILLAVLLPITVHLIMVESCLHLTPRSV